MTHRSRLPTILALGLTAVWGCASAAGRVPANCRSDLPRDARSLEEAGDSVAIQRGVEAAWEEGAGITLATIVYDSLGEYSRVDVISESLGDPARQGIKAALGAAARPSAAPHERVNLLVGDQRGPNVHRVEQFRSCAPEMLNRELVMARLQAEGRGLDVEELPTVTLWVQVRLDGLAGEVRVVESSGDDEVDAAAVRVARTGDLPTRHDRRDPDPQYLGHLPRDVFWTGIVLRDAPQRSPR